MKKISCRTTRLVTQLLVIAALLSACHYQNTHSSPAWVESSEMNEISGLAVSTRDRDVLWAHNDSGSGAYLYAMDQRGRLHGRVTLNNTGNRDWEDMAAFRWRDESWLLIADVGDNFAINDELKLHLIREPEMDNKQFPDSVDVTATYLFTYPDGARDCESIAVDTHNATILILSKRDKPARLYTLPLTLEPPANAITATFAGLLPHIPAPDSAAITANPTMGKWSSQPTALDLSPDGRWAAVLTYHRIYLYQHTPGMSWSAAFAAIPRHLEMPAMKQAEALSFMNDKHLFVTSENHPAPLYKLRIPKHAEL